jgi:hypothetical protein
MPIYSPTGNLDITNATLRTSNIETQNIKINNVAISAAHNLQQVTSIGNATTNTIEFNNSTTSLTTASNVTVGNELTVSGNIISNQEMTLAGNVTVGKNILLSSNTTTRVDSNVVVEHFGPHKRHPITPVLKKFPDVDFTQGKFDYNDSTRTYAQAGYVVSASSQSSGSEVWRLFDDGEWDQEDILKYPASSFQYNPTSNPNALGGVDGEWFKVEFPRKVIIDKFILNVGDTPNPGPKAFKVLGSDDDTDWQVVKEVTASYGTSAPYKTTVESVSSTAFRYYAVVITQLIAATQVSIREVEFYGYEEDPPAGDTSLDTTFTSVMNTPQTGGVKVYVDGPTLENKITTGPTPTLTGATYDSMGKYWSITSNISVEANTFMSGDQPHSVSMWFNSSNLEANVSNTCVFSISDQEKLDSQNLDLQSNTWHNLTYAYQGEGGSRVTYLDGRKVAEYQAEDTFGQYPPFAMTGYSQGGYVVSANSEYIETGDLRYAYGAYDPSVDFTGNAGHVWMTEFGTFNPNAVGGDTFTDSNGGTHTGHWNKLELPYKLKPSYLYYKNTGTYTAVRCASDWVILGSNDDIIWDLVHSSTTVLDTTLNIPINSTKAYKYLIFLCKTINGEDALYVQQLAYYGHHENDLVRLPDPTNVLKYPHIAMTGTNTVTNLIDAQGYHAQRNYVLTSSTGEAWNAFDDEIANTYWHTYGENNDSPNVPAGSTTYRGGTTGANSGLARTGVAREVTVDTLGVSHTGSWVDMETPNKLKVSSFKVHFGPQSGGYHPHSPTNYRLFGRNSTSDTWVKLFTIDGAYPNGTTPPQTGGTDKSLHTVGSTVFYKYHRWVCTKLHSTASDGTSLNNNAGIARSMLVRGLEFYGTEEATPVPIQIGGGNIDKVANFRVYDKFIGEDQALEIWDAQKDTFRGVKNSATLHKGRLGIGTTEPEGRLAVLDEPHNLEEFPPRAMTGYETYMEGHGVFKASASSFLDTSVTGGGWTRDIYPWYAFNKTNTYGWVSTPSVYTNGLADSDSDNRFGILGEWLEIQMPSKIKLKHFTLSLGYDEVNPSGTNTSRFPKVFNLYKSSDGVTWTTAMEITTPTAPAEGSYGTTYTYNINESEYYSRYLIQVKQTHSDTSGYSLTSSHTAIGEWRLFGTREQGQSVLHDGQLTLTKNLNVPRIGPPLDADDTPMRDRLVVEYNTSTNPTFEGAVRDTSGRGNDGVFYGDARYDPNDKALVFPSNPKNGSTVGTYDSVFAGGIFKHGISQFTGSIWVKLQSMGAWEQIFVLGQTGADKHDGLWVANSTELAVHSEGSSPNRIYYYRIGNRNGDWIHLTFVRNSMLYSDHALYVNGIPLSPRSASGSGSLAFPDETNLKIGGVISNNNYWLDGSISNFKLYDVALTDSEVKTLYDMGRNGSVANPQPLHISGPVNVMGDIRYITSRPLALPTMWDHMANGNCAKGVYPIVGTQGGGKVYNVYCEPDLAGGGWMCMAQISRNGYQTRSHPTDGDLNLFTKELGDSKNIRWGNTFSVPINILSNNSGYDLDIMVYVSGGTYASRYEGGMRLGSVWRGVNLSQALDPGVTGGNIGRSGLASSADGYTFTPRTPVNDGAYGLRTSSGWHYSISATGNQPGSYNDFGYGDGGWILHSGSVADHVGRIYGGLHKDDGTAENMSNSTNWVCARIFVRPSIY